MSSLPNLRLVILLGAKKLLEQNKAKKNKLYQQIKKILVPSDEFINNIRQLLNKNIVEEGSSWANEILLDTGSLNFLKSDNQLARLVEQFPFDKFKKRSGIMAHIKILNRMKQLIEEQGESGESKESEKMLDDINNIIEPPENFADLINKHFGQFPFLKNNEELKGLIERYSRIEEEEEEEEEEEGGVASIQPAISLPPPIPASIQPAISPSPPIPASIQPAISPPPPIPASLQPAISPPSPPVEHQAQLEEQRRKNSAMIRLQMENCIRCRESIVDYAQNKAQCDAYKCFFKFKQNNLKENYNKFRNSSLYPDQVDFDALADEYAQKMKDSPVLDQIDQKWDKTKIETIARTIDPLLLLKLCEEVNLLDDQTYKRIQNDATHRLHFAVQLVDMLLRLESDELNRIDQDPNHFAYYIVHILSPDEEDEDIPDASEDVHGPPPSGGTESLTIDYFVNQAQKKSALGLGLGEVKEDAENIQHLQQNIEDTFKKCVEKMESPNSSQFIRTRPVGLASDRGYDPTHVPESDRKHDPVEFPEPAEGIDRDFPGGRQQPTLSIISKASSGGKDMIDFSPAIVG